MKWSTIIATAVLMMACGSTEDPPQQDATVDATAIDAQPDAYVCRSDKDCDLGHDPGYSEPFEGRWQLTFHEEFYYTDEDMDGYLGTAVYPFIDVETGCSTDLEGTLSVIPHRYDDMDYFLFYYGYLYGNYKLTVQCEHDIHTETTSFSYWYWSLCVPGMLWCGRLLYDVYDVSYGDIEHIGGYIYDYTDEGDVMFFLTSTLDLNFHDNVTVMMHSELENVGTYGDCPEDMPVHCYLHDNCEHLFADCVPSKQECALLGGKSYSYHEPEHVDEPCNDIGGD